MKTASRSSSIPAAMALNMIALMGALPSAKKNPQNFVLKRLFDHHAQVSLQTRVDSRLSIESHDTTWFANYE